MKELHKCYICEKEIKKNELYQSVNDRYYHSRCLLRFYDVPPAAIVPNWNAKQRKEKVAV